MFLKRQFPFRIYNFSSVLYHKLCDLLWTFKLLLYYRKQAFEEDLAHYLGNDWKLIPKDPALENYIDHLKSLEESNPMLLLAYVYHLYLGLLSGGQILAKKRRVFGDGNYAFVSFIVARG